MNLIRWAWHGLHYAITGDFWPQNQCASTLSNKHPGRSEYVCCVRLKGHPGNHKSSGGREWK